MFSEQEIERLNKQYKFKCNIFYDSILINSVYRNWICEQRGQFYRLKHLNGKQCKYKNHMHNKKYNNLAEVFKYIHNHDTNTILDRDKKSRLKFDKLFNQIGLRV